jgi:hypothetical protein
MANPTTNFGWQMPTATDLVTDLPADFDVFGQAVDTDLVGLKGGTTGQVLAKASGTDLDFVWSADAAGMTNPMTTTADIIYSSSGSTPARLGIGSAADVLTVDGSGVPTWAAPAAPASGLTLITRNTFSNVAAVTLDSIFSATYKAYRVVIEDVYAATQTNPLYMQLRYSGATETGSTYAGSSYGVDRDGSAVIITNSDFATQFSLSVSSGGNATDTNSSYSFTISKVGVSGNPSWNGTGFNGYVYRSLVIGGLNSQTRTYDGMVLKASASNITGTISIYGLGI